MRFIKYGKTYQLEINSSEDIRTALNLDEALWVASSAPVSSLRTDTRFLEYVDYDENGRINTREIKTAIEWLLSRVKDFDALNWGADTMPIDNILPATANAKSLRSAAEYVLRTQDQADTTNISLPQVRQFLSGLKQQPLNGDGVIIPESATNPESAQFIRDVMACSTGGTEDIGGRQGITEDQLNAFMASVDNLLSWHDRAQNTRPDGSSSLMPFGSETSKAYSLYLRLKAPVSAYFSLSKGMAYEPGLRTALTNEAADFQGLALRNAETLHGWLLKLPIANPANGPALPLDPDSINPVYRSDIELFCSSIVFQPTGEPCESLSEEDWTRIEDSFREYAQYAAQRESTEVDTLPVEVLKRYRDEGYADVARELIVADRKVREVAQGVERVEKLLLFQQNLLRLLNNFINFSELYDTGERSLFETGSLLIDGRWFNLALKTDDVNAHAAIAKTSNIFTLYLEITNKNPAQKFIVAVPATSGARGNLVTGKRGVFFDLDKREYDARIISIIENPISLKEALALPFKRLWGFVIGKIEAISNTSEKNLQKATDALFKNDTTAPQAAPGSAAPATMLVGLSVSIAALGSAFAFISNTLSGMSSYQLYLSLLGAAAVVIVPVSLVAALKLARQDMSSLLEGCGWAINSRMRFNNRLRRQITHHAPYPEGAEGTPPSPWLKLLLIIAAACLVMLGIQRAFQAAAESPASTQSPPVTKTAHPATD